MFIPYFFALTSIIVIARYEAIANCAVALVQPRCKVGDCFVPRNDVESYASKICLAESPAILTIQ